MGAKEVAAGEAGLTLIETLVMLVITALVALLIMPTAERGVRDNFAVAARIASSVDRSFSEGDYRLLLRQATPPIADAQGYIADRALTGNARSVRFPSESDGSGPCPDRAGYSVVSLDLERDKKGGQLICEASGRRTVLLSWEAGDAAFSYSRDGKVWTSSWPAAGRRMMIGRSETEPADRPAETPLVRLTVTGAGPASALWVERAGDPALRDASTGKTNQRGKSFFGWKS